MKPKYHWMRPLLGMTMTAGLLFLVVYLSVKGLRVMSKEAMFLYGAILQTVILLVKDCYGFYFGSSQGSSEKADTIDNIVNGK